VRVGGREIFKDLETIVAVIGVGHAAKHQPDDRNLQLASRAG
jgi:hypothetical protein